MRLAERAIFGLTLLVLLPAVLVPQDRDGEIRGLAVDTTREPIQVVLRGTGIERTVQGDDAGFYRFIGLPAGEYELTIIGPFSYISIRAVGLQRSAVRVLPAIELAFRGIDCTGRFPAYLRPLDRFDADRGALGGVIVDDYGRVLTEAKVTLFVPNAGVKNSTVTDRDGRFSFADIPLRRDYKIEVVRDGYFTEEFADFKIQAGYEAVYDRFYLEPCEKGRCQSSLKTIRVLPACA
jgi:hypothetical protein